MRTIAEIKSYFMPMQESGGGSLSLSPGATKRVATGFSAASLILKLRAIGRNERENRLAAEINAQIAERNAKIVKEKADFEEARKRESSEALLSRQRALFGKAGVEISGSAALVLEQTAVKEEIDALAIRRAGFLDIQDILLNASFLRINAKQAKETANFERLSAFVQFGESLAKAATGG